MSAIFHIFLGLFALFRFLCEFNLKMEDDFVCASLKNDRTKLVIPRKWWQIDRGHNIRVIRFGVRPWQKQKIFYGPDKNELPNFNLRCAQEFDGQMKNCYMAHVLNIFGRNNEQMIFLYFTLQVCDIF